jgi:C4-dicarboxylate transporter, DctM subunit
VQDAALLFILLFVLFCIGLPIAFSILLSSILFLLITDMRPLIVVSQRVFTGLDIFPFLAIPLFILMGNLMEKSGISKRLIDLVDLLAGNTTGGIGIVTILSCTIFGALTGSAPATVVAIGVIMIPAMINEGKYPPKLAAGIITSAGALGNIIPPSIALILYGATVNVSIPRLFIGNIIPGLLISFAFIITNIFLVRRLKIKKIEKPKHTLQEALFIVWRAVPPLFLPVIILGGIYGGVFTPTEAAAIGVLGSLIIGLFYKLFTVKNLLQALSASVQTSAMVGFILGAAGIFGWIIVSARVPTELANAITPILKSKEVYLAVLTVFLLFVGCIMDAGASIIILGPMLSPIGWALGVDPIHLGVVFCVNLVIGFFTPPFGLNLFTTVSLTKQPFTDVVEGVFPFIFAAIAMLILVAYVPQLVMWLPNLSGI